MRAGPFALIKTSSIARGRRFSPFFDVLYCFKLVNATVINARHVHHVSIVCG